MRSLILALIPILLVACGDDTVALTSTDGSSTLGPGTSGSSGDPTSPTTTSAATTTTTTTGPGTSVGSDSATDSATTSTVTTDATSSTSGDTGTTLDPSAGSSTGEPGSSSGGTTGGTTGGALGCGMDGPELDATLVHIGVDPGCGPLEFIGTNASDSAGPVYPLDGCPCGANCLKPDPWTLTLDVPMQWLPGKLPACPRIVVERQKSKKGCELVGVSIWDSQAPADVPAHYHAGSLLGPIAAAKAELQTAQIEVETCDCDNCCNTPTRLDLKFSIAKKTATLAEGEEILIGGEGDPWSYQIKNFQSHLTGICDDSPHIDWAMIRVTPP